MAASSASGSDQLQPQPSPGITLLPGAPEPLGPSRARDGGGAINFSLFSKNATGVTLLLKFSDEQAPIDVPLDAAKNRSGDHWHIAVAGLPLAGVRYAFRLSGAGGWDTGHRWDARIPLLDPYAPLVSLRPLFGVPAPAMYTTRYGMYDFASPPFDWGDEPTTRPRIPFQDLVIYEVRREGGILGHSWLILALDAGARPA